jgi:hypothetical protein
VHRIPAWCSVTLGNCDGDLLGAPPLAAPRAPASHQGRDPLSSRRRHLVAARRAPAPRGQGVCQSRRREPCIATRAGLAHYESDDPLSATQMASVCQLLTIGGSSTIQDRSVDLSSPRSCIPPNPAMISRRAVDRSRLIETATGRVASLQSAFDICDGLVGCGGRCCARVGATARMTE